MRFLVPVLALSLLQVSCASKSPKSIKVIAVETSTCSSAREFITTMTFLRRSALAGNDANARKIADQVVVGCDGAAARFIRVARVLQRANLANADIVREALHFSGQKDAVVGTFIEVFKMAYVKRFLDLPLVRAISVARKLSLGYGGEVAIARADFVRIVRFCVGDEHLNMPRVKCADLAVGLAQSGSRFPDGVSDSFLKAYRFLSKSSPAPNLPMFESIRISKEIVKHGPGAVENFELAYRYAVGKKGLALEMPSALKFAMKMAERSVPVATKDVTLKLKR
jgi:hypothetical protein